MFSFYSEYDKPKEYAPYKAEKFEKYKQKASMLLRGVNDLSLRENDKKLLIEEIKKIILNF